eukprot:6999733-Prymnesium_polylepis.1
MFSSGASHGRASPLASCRFRVVKMRHSVRARWGLGTGAGATRIMTMLDDGWRAKYGGTRLCGPGQ